MADSFNKEIILNLNKKKINDDMTQVEALILAGVTKVNQKLQSNPVYIRVKSGVASNDDKTEEYRDNTGYSLDGLGGVLGDIKKITQGIFDKLGDIKTQSFPSSSEILVGGKGKWGGLEKIIVGLGTAAKSAISNFDNFDEAINALASRTMSFADILDTAKNNVDLGYFAEMIGASQGEVFRAVNTGSKYHLSQGESLRLLQQAADMNRQIADKTDPNHENVRFKKTLDVLSKYDSRIYETGYKTEDGKTHTYTAEERQKILIDAINALRKVDVDAALAASRDLGHNNAKAVALYSDKERFNDFSREKKILYQGKWISLSEYQQVSQEGSRKVDKKTGDLEDSKAAQLAGAIIDSGAKVEQHLQSKIQTTDDATRVNLAGSVALQQDTNQDINLGRTIFNAKGLLAGWGLYNMGASAFPLLNPSNGERMITDLPPELKQAALAGRQQGTPGGTQPMGAGGAALAQEDVINMQTVIARSIYTNKAREQYKGQIEQLAKQNHASPDQIKELVSDKALDKIINQPDVQRIINEQIKVYLSTFKLGQKEQDKSVNELFSLGLQTAGSAGLAYAYPQSALFTAPAMAMQFQAWRENANNYVPAAKESDMNHLSKTQQNGQQVLNQSALRSFWNIFAKSGMAAANKKDNSLNNNLNKIGMPILGGAHPDFQYQKLMREYSFTDSRTMHSFVNVYTNSNDPRTIGNVVQEKLSMVFKKPAKNRPLGMIGPDTDQIHRGQPL